MKNFFKGVWQFCSYLFWTQLGSKKRCCANCENNSGSYE